MIKNFAGVLLLTTILTTGCENTGEEAQTPFPTADSRVEEKKKNPFDTSKFVLIEKDIPEKLLDAPLYKALPVILVSHSNFDLPVATTESSVSDGLSFHANGELSKEEPFYSNYEQREEKGGCILGKISNVVPIRITSRFSIRINEVLDAYERNTDKAGKTIGDIHAKKGDNLIDISFLRCETAITFREFLNAFEPWFQVYVTPDFYESTRPLELSVDTLNSIESP